jgi:hypothetical protein
VKLLDFGLARLQRRADASGETATTTGFGQGILAGTLPYMAPEQLEGREADARTDIWALGCVLFEMLAGRRAFAGDSQARLIAAIEKDDAPSLAPAAASPVVERLVRQCLEKRPEDRFQSARDVALALEALSGPRSGEAVAPRRPRRRWLMWAGLLAVATAGVLVALWVARTRGTAAIGPATPVTSDAAVEWDVALSPDGRHRSRSPVSLPGRPACPICTSS